MPAAKGNRNENNKREDLVQSRHDRSSQTLVINSVLRAFHQPPNQRLRGRFRGLRIIVTVVSTSSGSITSSSTTYSTEVVFGMCVVEEELTMLGVGEATRRVLEGGGTVGCELTV